MRARHLDSETWRQPLAGSATADGLFMHDLEERCDVRASNIEFVRAAVGAHA